MKVVIDFKAKCKGCNLLWDECKGILWLPCNDKYSMGIFKSKQFNIFHISAFQTPGFLFVSTDG